MDATLLATDKPMIKPSSVMLWVVARVVAVKAHTKDVRNQLCFQQEEPHAAWPVRARKTEATHSPSVSLQDRKLL
jgi:hypothetical protein